MNLGETVRLQCHLRVLDWMHEMQAARPHFFCRVCRIPEWRSSAPPFWYRQHSNVVCNNHLTAPRQED